MSPKFPRKEVTRLAREAEKRGWTAERTGSGHLRLTSPLGAVVICSSTPKTTGSYKTVNRLEQTGEW
jgi:predicted RNA binding protein YcfA (HicA-like mRNA interferase family)